jgi:predicted neuraminidase
LIAAGEKPFFKNEIINPGQLLPMVHVASLAELSDGALAAVWYGGTAECSPDVQIFFSTRQESEGWSKPHTIMTRVQAEDDLGRPMKSLGNAVLLANANGSLRLLFVTIAMGKWSGSQLNSSRSEDGGLTWLRTERLTLSPLCNFSELVRNRPIPLQGGGWCVPIYQEFLGKFPELLWLREARGDLIVQKTRIAGGCSTLQPSVVPLSPHSGLVLLRDYTQAKKIFLSRTEDGGLSWSKPEPTLLPNPDAGISGLRISGGRLLVAFNDSMLNRENLSLALSADEGRSWGRIATLENEQGGSFSYPYLLHTSDGSIAMAYTWKSKQIKLVRFNEAWITAQEKRSAGL